MKRISSTSAALICLLVMGASPALPQGSAEGVLSAGTVVRLQLNDYLSTKLSTEGDTFSATVIVPVYVKERLVLPKGSIVTGSVSRVQRPGRFRGKAMMNLMFQTVRTPGGRPVEIVASLLRVDPDGNEGAGPENTVEGERSLGKDAGRVAKPSLSGAGIGALIGGGRGAAVGAGAGAAVGLATVFATRGRDLEVRRGATMDIKLERPLQLPPEQDPPGRIP